MIINYYEPPETGNFKGCSNFLTLQRFEYLFIELTKISYKCGQIRKVLLTTETQKCVFSYCCSFNNAKIIKCENFIE